LPAVLDQLIAEVDGQSLILCVGAPLAKALGREVPGLRSFPQLDAVVENPATQHALWLWLRGEERGDLFLRAQALERCWPRRCAWPTALMVSCTVAGMT
jgi:putative iron-dependent peroxidase